MAIKTDPGHIPQGCLSLLSCQGKSLTPSPEALASSALHASPSLEPEETKDPANAHLFLEDFGDGHTRIDELLSSLIADAGHK